jgi:hypothetical protein
VNTPLTHPFDSESAYRAAIDVTLAAARSEIRIFDRDLLQMGLGERDRIALLTEFLAGGRDRRLRIVVHDVTPLEQCLPRLIELMRWRGHLIETRRTPDHMRHLADCWVLADGSHATIRFHADHARGKLISNLPTEVEPWWRRFDDLWLECEMCTPGATTGL